MSSVPAHKPADLKTALDAYADALGRVHDLEQQRRLLDNRIRQAGAECWETQKIAAKALRHQEGAVVHRGRSWKVRERTDVIDCEVIQVNLDAAARAADGEATDLSLTQPPSEKAA
jgi:hypothetical protein